MIVLQQPTPNEISNFNNYSRNLDLSNTSIGNFSQIPSQTTMYQTASQYQTQPSFVYGNPSITYNNNSRTSSASSFPRQTPIDASFGFDSNSYSQLNYNNRYDQSSNTGNTLSAQPDVSKASTLQQNPSAMIPSPSTANIPADSSNVLPPLSEVFPSSSSNAQSPTPQQVQNAQQVQAQQQAASVAAANVAAAAAQNGFFQPMYSDVNAAAANAAAASYAAAADGGYSQQAAALSQQTQIATNIPVDPRTLPGIQTAAFVDPTRRNSSNALLAINTGLTMGGDQPLSAGSSAPSPIVAYHTPAAAAHQALLNSHFMNATQSINGGMMAQRTMNGHRKAFRSDGDDLTSPVGERPQKVYSFVALPGINTKKRPRRRYDEIERHYACNYPGCTKSYGTLNHLNAHVQMQKHGPKRHPSEFKELRKQWRRQKREEEERKAAEVAAAKNAVVGSLGISPLPSI